MLVTSILVLIAFPVVTSAGIMLFADRKFGTLVYQAAEQFRLFTGEPAPVQAMYAAGRQALGR